MAVREILHYPDDRLRTRARPVEAVDEGIRTLIDDMFETMYQEEGIGLAAVQVNVAQRVIVLDVSAERTDPVALVNPEIVEREGTEQTQEGCLSIPGYFEWVERAHRVRVGALDRDGEPFELDAEGLKAVCIQHELDHLEGKLFVDYLSELKRNRIRKRLQKQRQQAPARGGSAVL